MKLLLTFMMCFSSTAMLFAQLLPIISPYPNVLKFDGVDNYVNINAVANDLNGGSALSVEVRFKTNDSPSNDKGSQLISFHGSNYANILKVGVASNGGIYVKGTTSAVRGAGFNDNVWHMLSLVITSNGLCFAYLDGLYSYEFLIGTVAIGSIARASLGQEYDGSGTTDHFKGRMSEVRIWSKALTVQEIHSQMCQVPFSLNVDPGDASHGANYWSDLVAYYDFKGSHFGLDFDGNSNVIYYPNTLPDSRTTLLDKSINRNDGFIHNIHRNNDWARENVPCDTSQVDLVQFSIVGDAPYDYATTTNRASVLRAHVLKNNDLSYAESLVHIGDIKKGSTPCDRCESGAYYYYYQSALDTMLLSTKPVNILIGDNEWNDCDDPALALNVWNSTFSTLNNDFVNDFYANRQAARPENIAYIKNSVLFITINQVDQQHPSRSTAEDDDHKDRMSDNADWVKYNLEKYKKHVHACVVCAHAKPDVLSNIVPTNTFRTPFLQAADAFENPILYMQGNTHGWDRDPSYGGLDNVLKIVIPQDYGSKDLMQVVVTKNKEVEHAFYYELNPFSNHIQGSPTVEATTSSAMYATWTTEKAVASVLRYKKLNQANALTYMSEDTVPKTKHLIVLNNLDDASSYAYEIGTRTAKLSGPHYVQAIISWDGSILNREKAPEEMFNDVSLLPNSVKEVLQIAVGESLKDKDYRVELVDLLGKVVISVTNSKTLNMSNLNQGVYLVYILDPSKTQIYYSGKVLKQ